MSIKPAYRDRYPCNACRTGYLDCASYASFGAKCCESCDGHPERFAKGKDAYTPEETADMNARHR